MMIRWWLESSPAGDRERRDHVRPQGFAGRLRNFRFVFSSEAFRHHLVMILTHRFFPASPTRDLCHSLNGIPVITLLPTDKTDIRRDYLRAGTPITANHRCSAHERFCHGKPKSFVEARRVQQCASAGKELGLSLAAHVSDVFRPCLLA